MGLTEHDYLRYMRRCLDLAQLGEYYVAPNPMVGAVLVDAEGTIISEGYHQRYGEAHAEVNCLQKFTAHEIHAGATLFVSLEPCSHYGKTPPCADLIIEKGIRKVVVGCLDPNPQVAGRGVTKLRQAGIEVITGILEDECRILNKRFICLQEKKRPYVILKWAQTADGVLGVRTDVCEEQPRLRISNTLTKQIVHKMRAENMAILVGTNTALLDNPKLLNTHWTGRNPIRILLDRHCRVPSTANIFSNEAPTIIYSDNTDWEFVLHDMASHHIHSVLVEGGAQVLNSILQSGLYDEIHIEVSPYTTEELLAHQKRNNKSTTYVFAPTIPLPAQPTEVIEGNKLYQILH